MYVYWVIFYMVESFWKADSGEQAETLWNMLSLCQKESFPQTSILKVLLVH